MWFKSYLTNHKQITRVNNTESNPIDNKYGVPQGSILGALLLYTSTIWEKLWKSVTDGTLIFTDDKTVSRKLNNGHGKYK